MHSQQGTGSSYKVHRTVMMKTEIFWDWTCGLEYSYWCFSADCWIHPYTTQHIFRLQLKRLNALP